MHDKSFFKSLIGRFQHPARKYFKRCRSQPGFGAKADTKFSALEICRQQQKHHLQWLKSMKAASEKKRRK